MCPIFKLTALVAEMVDAAIYQIAVFPERFASSNLVEGTKGGAKPTKNSPKEDYFLLS